jgi:hypothetical protein
MKKILYFSLFLPYLIYSQVDWNVPTIKAPKIKASNPYQQPVQLVVTQNPWVSAANAQNMANQNFANNIRAAAARGAFKTAGQKAEDIVSLKDKNLNQYKYIVISNISAAKDKEVKKMKAVVLEELKQTNYIILDDFNKIPKELEDNLDMCLLLSVSSQNDGWPFKKVILFITDYDGNIIHQRGVRHDRSAHYLTKLTLSSIARHPHVFRKQIVLDKNKITRQEAIKKLKEAKDLFDSGIINSLEYEVFSNKYKPIIININD